MNAGTLTQALTASRYKANPTAGSREKQEAREPTFFTGTATVRLSPGPTEARSAYYWCKYCREG